MDLYPAIVNKSLENSELCRLLRKSFKVRVSDGTHKESIILPKNSIAFLVQPISALINQWDGESMERLEKFTNLHKQPYVLLTSNSPTNEEYVVISQLQQRFLKGNVVFIPTSGASRCAAIIENTVLSKPSSGVAWARQQVKGAYSESNICRILKRHIGIPPHDAMVVQDGCGTLANISLATVDQLMECSVSAKNAKKIAQFFHNANSG